MLNWADILTEAFGLLVYNQRDCACHNGDQDDDTHQDTWFCQQEHHQIFLKKLTKNKILTKYGFAISTVLFT